MGHVEKMSEYPPDGDAPSVQNDIGFIRLDTDLGIISLDEQAGRLMGLSLETGSAPNLRTLQKRL